MPKKQETNMVTVWAVAITLIIGIAAIIWMAKPDSQSQNSAQVNSGTAELFDVSESVFDFGAISMADGKVSHTFQVKNSGDAPLELRRLYTSCMCTTVVLRKGGDRFGPFGMQGHGYTPRINKKFAPGDEAELEVVFDPSAHGPSGIGPVERVVELETSAGTQQIGIRAMVKP